MARTTQAYGQRNRIGDVDMKAGLVPSRSIARSAPAGAMGRQRWLFVNICFAAFIALVLVGVSPVQEWVSPVEAGGGDLANQLLHAGIFLALALSSGGNARSGSDLLALPLGIALLLGYCLITVSWAIDPAISLRRLILTAMVIWVVFRCVRDLGYGQTLKIVQYTLLALLIINYLAVLLTDSGVHPELPGEEASVVGDWRGILPHKNVTGAICAFTVILAVFDAGRISKAGSYAAIVGSLVFLYFTHSKTSETMLVLALLCGWIIRPYNASFRTAAGIGALAVAGFAIQLVSLYSDVFENILNDSGGLTGRDAIWPLLVEYWRAHPWTGAGFNSFWLIGDASPIWMLTSGWVAQDASHGHNGYLDLLVTIGLPGLVLAVVTLLLWPFVRLLVSRGIDKPQRSLLLALMIFCAGHNLTESTIMNGASIVQVMLVMAVAFIYHLSDPPPLLGQRR